MAWLSASQSNSLGIILYTKSATPAHANVAEFLYTQIGGFMSVRVNDRHLSDIEYENTYGKLNEYIPSKLKRLPKRYRHFLGQPFNEVLNNIYTDFARRRVNSFIEDAKREYGGENLYALVFDFKSYFDSIPHEQCYRVLKKYLYDERLVELTIGIIESYKLRNIATMDDEEQRNKTLERLHNHKDVGICLGSQISQIMAVAVPNEFDHYIKDVLKLKYYERYMDDEIIIFNDKEKLLQLKSELSELAKKYGLRFNDKKTYVVKLTKGFTFLKIKYHINAEGKTVKRLVRSGIVRERRKLKKFKNKVEHNEMSLDDVYNNIQSWNAHSKIAKCYTTSKNMFGLYNKYFNGYKMTQKYFKDNPNVVRRRKVIGL